jgi:hypothetical protein
MFPMSLPRATARLALALWAVLAFVVWNVVFDRMLVVAGRQYVQAAVTAANARQPFLPIDTWMPPATARAVRTATLAGGLVLFTGAVLVPLASWRDGSVRRGGTTE